MPPRHLLNENGGILGSAAVAIEHRLMVERGKGEPAHVLRLAGAKSDAAREE